MKRILVVEDNPANRELLRELLSAWGYEVVEAVDGGQALEKVRSASPDLVLLDIGMPVLDGFAVVRELRKDPHFLTLPVVAVSAYAMRGDQEKALQAGFNAYLTKPIDAAALKKQIDLILR